MFAASKTAGASGVPSDPYFYDVSLLLNGDGTNGAQNNTFLDSSTNNFTITRNGNTTQGSFSPYGNLWSNYFNGSSYLGVASNSSFAPGTGDFAIQAWVFINSIPSDFAPIMQNDAVGTSGSDKFWFGYNSSSLTLNQHGTGNRAYTSWNPTVNTWYHVAASRVSGTVYLFINGLNQSVTNSTIFNSTSFGQNGVSIGVVSSPYYFNGYISNLEYQVGTGFTSITVPTTPLIAGTNCKLLTCQSNRFYDASSNAFAITTSGSPSVQRFSPFNPTAPYSTTTIGGSGYFDGSSYLTMASNSAFSPGTGDFTVECWVNFNPSVTPEVAFFTTTNNISGASGQLWFGYSGGQLRISQHGTGAYIVGYTWSPGINNWHYVTSTRASGTTKLYVDGILVVTSTVQNGVNFTQSGAMIGVLTGNAPPYMQGYLTDVRYTVGTALYSTTFTPPTAPLTSSGSTTFLASFQNAGIPDLAMQNDLQTVGSAQVSTSTVKYGTGSLYFDGSTGYLTAPNKPVYQLGSGDFTIECWINFNSLSTCLLYTSDAADE